MFVCVFAKEFPALASQSCCEVSRPRAVEEYEYLFSFSFFHVVRHFRLSLLNNFYCDTLHLYNIIIPNIN